MATFLKNSIKSVPTPLPLVESGSHYIAQAGPKLTVSQGINVTAICHWLAVTILVTPSLLTSSTFVPTPCFVCADTGSCVQMEVRAQPHALFLRCCLSHPPHLL